MARAYSTADRRESEKLLGLSLRRRTKRRKKRETTREGWLLVLAYA
jgi:hypothetical protein